MFKEEKSDSIIFIFSHKMLFGSTMAQDIEKGLIKERNWDNDVESDSDTIQAGV